MDISIKILVELDGVRCGRLLECVLLFGLQLTLITPTIPNVYQTTRLIEECWMNMSTIYMQCAIITELD
jgi:hypothetical protein